MTTRVIVDTCVVSYVMKGAAEAALYEKHLDRRLLSVSFVTVGELYFGAEKKGWGAKRRAQLETVLKNHVVIPYDNEIARCFARIAAERERQGRPISWADAWIAACAVRHEVPLVTHNARDFEGIAGLQVISERGPTENSQS